MSRITGEDYRAGYCLGLTKSASLLRDSKTERRRLQPLISTETNRLTSLGLDPLLSGSIARRINLPGESDIDFAVGTGNIQRTSRMLERNGIPFAKMKGNNRLHKYTTRDGVPIDVQVRPSKEVDFLRSGTAIMASLPSSEISKILKEKDRLKRSGNKAAYKKYKYGVYERHGVFPKDGDWSNLK